jgi:hypothetical protein
MADFVLDPSRYYGHTPGPWMVGISSGWKCVRAQSYSGPIIAGPQGLNNEKNWDLLADAPAILAEAIALRAQKDGAYLERNTCVAAMAKMALALGWKAVRTKTAIEGWSEDWHGVVYIQFPDFQASWHFHDSQAYLFEFLPEEPTAWDGHTTEQKYENLKAYANGEQEHED